MALIVCIPRHVCRVMLKLVKKKARRHFVTLIEISVYLINAFLDIPGIFQALQVLKILINHNDHCHLKLCNRS